MSVKKKTSTGKKGTRVYYQARCRDASGTVRAKDFDKKADAEAWEAETKVAVKRGTFTADSQSVTVAEAGKLWVDGKKLKAREWSTVKGYEGWLENHIVPALGAEKLSRLTMPRINEFAEELLAKGCSHAMTKKVLGGLRMLLTDAMGRGLVAQNVAKGVRADAPKRLKKKIRVPAREEVKAILDAARDHNPHWFAMLLVGAVTGLRISELRGLRWVDIDLKAGTVSVEQRADLQNVIGPCKSEAAYRTLTLAPAVVAELKVWKLKCPKGELGLAFPNTAGGVVNYHNFANRSFKGIQKAAKIAKPYNVHELRHAAASNWISQRVDLKRLQTWLGHATAAMTLDIYGHLIPDEVADEALAAGAVAGLL